MGMVTGRPTKYGPHIIQKAQEYFQKWEPYYECPVEKQDKNGNVTTEMKRVPNGAPTALRLADHLGINRCTVFDWENKYKQFSDCIKEGTKKCFRTGMYENGLTGEWSAAMAIFLGKNLLGMSDKKEVMGAGGGPLVVTLSKEDEDI